MTISFETEDQLLQSFRHHQEALAKDEGHWKDLYLATVIARRHNWELAYPLCLEAWRERLNPKWVERCITDCPEQIRGLFFICQMHESRKRPFYLEREIWIDMLKHPNLQFKKFEIEPDRSILTFDYVEGILGSTHKIRLTFRKRSELRVKKNAFYLEILNSSMRVYSYYRKKRWHISHHGDPPDFLKNLWEDLSSNVRPI